MAIPSLIRSLIIPLTVHVGTDEDIYFLKWEKMVDFIPAHINWRINHRMEMNGIPFICKSKSSGASIRNLEHLLAELKRTDLKLREWVTQAYSAQCLVTLISVAIADGVGVYNKRMVAGK
jgi:hypothetical protein